jgi:hypothetical protein
MSVSVSPLPAAHLVTLVNGWGARPLQVGNRDTPAQPEESAVADRLFAVFAADPPERARLVSAMLTDTMVRPQLIEAGGRYTAAWSVPEPRFARLAAAALGLREHLLAYPERLGVCADRQCADVYVDVSRAGHRRFCSTTCQTRTRVAAFRKRRGNGTAPGLQRDDTSSAPSRAGRPGAA